MNLACLLAACYISRSEPSGVEDVASWFETPLIRGCPVTPIDLYAADRMDLIGEFASARTAPETILAAFEPEWRDRYSTPFETVTMSDGNKPIRP